jgi:hypothetical protein
MRTTMNTTAIPLSRLSLTSRPRELSTEAYLILDRMDVDAAMRDVAVLGFRPASREIAKAGMHKTRIIAGRAFTRVQRDQSRKWLLAHGFKIPGQP